MRTIIAGLTRAGLTRQSIIGTECVASVDLHVPDATYPTIQDVPINSYDVVLVCTSNENKYNLIRYALANKKHVLVEAPLWCPNTTLLKELIHLAVSNKVTLYPAYSWCFEPKVINLRNAVVTGALGDIYHTRAFLRQVGQQVIDPVAEPGAQILHLLYFCYGEKIFANHLNVLRKRRITGAMAEHIIFGDLNSPASIEVEINLLSDRDNLVLDVYGEDGGMHLDSLDYNLALEFEFKYFKQLCLGIPQDLSYQADFWIMDELRRLSKEELLLA